MKTSQATKEHSREVAHKLKIRTNTSSAIPLPGMHPKEMKSRSRRDAPPSMQKQHDQQPTRYRNNLNVHPLGTAFKKAMLVEGVQFSG